MKDYYKILEIDPNCTKDDIRKAYKRLAKQWHPDNNKSANAHERFVEITEAFEILFDDNTRAKYDAARMNAGSTTSDSYYENYEHSYEYRTKTDFSKEQERAREKGKYYSNISFEEFMQKAFDIIVEIGIGTIYGDNEFNQNKTFKTYMGIGAKAWISILLVIASFTGVLAPVSIPILIKLNMISKDRFVGIKNIIIGMFVFLVTLLGSIFLIYLIVNAERYKYLLVAIVTIALFFLLIKNKIINFTFIKWFFAIIASAILLVIIGSILFNSISVNNKYKKAKQLILNEQYPEAINILNEISDYKDSSELRADARLEIDYQRAMELYNQGEYRIAISRFSNLGEYKDSKDRFEECMNRYYDIGISYIHSKEYLDALEIFLFLGGYKDSISHLDNVTELIYIQAKDYINEGEYNKARKNLMRIFYYLDSIELLQGIGRGISAGSWHIIGMTEEGVLKSAGNYQYGQRNFSTWDNIELFSAGGIHSVGLKSDGTLVGSGDNDFGRLNIDKWKDIVDVASGNWNTVGIKSDGSVIATGDNEFGQLNLQDWEDVVAVSVTGKHIIGLKKDATVLGAGDNSRDQIYIDHWDNMVSIAAGEEHTVGLLYDGTVWAKGNNDYGQCNTVYWNDIVAIAAGDWHTVGLKADGTVVATGDNEYNRTDVEGWEDVVAIGAGAAYTIGLKKDGTVLITGSNKYNLYEVESWNNIIVSKPTTRQK